MIAYMKGTGEYPMLVIRAKTGLVTRAKIASGVIKKFKPKTIPKTNAMIDVTLVVPFRRTKSRLVKALSIPTLVATAPIDIHDMAKNTISHEKYFNVSKSAPFIKGR